MSDEILTYRMIKSVRLRNLDLDEVASDLVEKALAKALVKVEADLAAAALIGLGENPSTFGVPASRVVSSLTIDEMIDACYEPLYYAVSEWLAEDEIVFCAAKDGRPQYVVCRPGALDAIVAAYPGRVLPLAEVPSLDYKTMMRCVCDPAGPEPFKPIDWFSGTGA